jgi:hypothetical protein
MPRARTTFTNIRYKDNSIAGSECEGTPEHLVA